MSDRYNAQDFLSRFTEVEKLELFKVLIELPQLTREGPWLAGGAVRRTLIGKSLDSDFDFFFRDKDQFDSFKAKLIDLGCESMRVTDHVETYQIYIKDAKRIVQPIKIQYFDSLESVLDSFDFTITQAGYDGIDLVLGKYTLWDLARRSLALHKLTFGVSTLRRMIKYTNQGFTACSGVLQAILEAAASNPDTIQTEIQYVD